MIRSVPAVDRIVTSLHTHTNSYANVLSPIVTIFGYRTFKEVSRVK